MGSGHDSVDDTSVPHNLGTSTHVSEGRGNGGGVGGVVGVGVWAGGLEASARVQDQSSIFLDARADRLDGSSMMGMCGVWMLVCVWCARLCLCVTVCICVFVCVYVCVCVCVYLGISVHVRVVVSIVVDVNVCVCLCPCTCPCMCPCVTVSL